MAQNSRQGSASGARTGRFLRSAAAMLLGIGVAVADNPASAQAGPGDSEKATRLQAMERVARGVVMRKVDGSSEPIAPLDDPYQAPDGYPIKASAQSGLYYPPSSALYDHTIAEVWLSSEEVAQANGFIKAD